MNPSIKKEIYFDNNATTQPLKEVCEAMMEVLGSGFGNPSSGHAAGERARTYINRAREALSNLLSVDPQNIFFLSGATEANNMVFASMSKGPKKRILTTTVEHSSIIKYSNYLMEQSVEVVLLPVDHKGFVSLYDLGKAITDSTSLVSVQWVNNETGVIQPIQEIGEICRKHGVLFHTDAAQAAGKVVMNVERMPIDFLSLSGHKFHAPQGIGALYARNPKTLTPILRGGPQEYGLRPGTENLPGIVGIGKAAEIRLNRFEQILKKMRALRDRFESAILQAVPGAEINGDPQMRVPNTTNLLFKGIDGQALVARLDQLGIRCSQSSACTNQSPEPSYVLRAMGLSEDEAYSSIRFSFSELNTIEEVDFVVNKVVSICDLLRKFSLNSSAVSLQR